MARKKKEVEAVKDEADTLKFAGDAKPVNPGVYIRRYDGEDTCHYSAWDGVWHQAAESIEHAMAARQRNEVSPIQDAEWWGSADPEAA